MPSKYLHERYWLDLSKFFHKLLVLQSALQLLKILVGIWSLKSNWYTIKVYRGVTTNHSLCQIHRIHEIGVINDLQLAHALPRFVSVKLLLCTMLTTKVNKL